MMIKWLQRKFGTSIAWFRFKTRYTQPERYLWQQEDFKARSTLHWTSEGKWQSSWVIRRGIWRLKVNNILVGRCKLVVKTPHLLLKWVGIRIVKLALQMWMDIHWDLECQCSWRYGIRSVACRHPSAYHLCSCSFCACTCGWHLCAIIKTMLGSSWLLW